MEFESFPKIARLNREIVISEKIDGTNAAVLIEIWDPTEVEIPEAHPGFTVVDGTIYFVGAQSRKRLITPDSDNFGFAGWVWDNAEELVRLMGPGRHFGEWWGLGIQRGYGQTGKRFSLFNPTFHWGLAMEDSPLRGDHIVDTVPVLYEGPFWNPEDSDPEPTPWHAALWVLRNVGSIAAPGFDRPEGIVVYHTAARTSFKVTLEHDEAPKGVTGA